MAFAKGDRVKHWLLGWQGCVGGCEKEYYVTWDDNSAGWYGESQLCKVEKATAAKPAPQSADKSVPQYKVGDVVEVTAGQYYKGKTGKIREFCDDDCAHVIIDDYIRCLRLDDLRPVKPAYRFVVTDTEDIDWKRITEENKDADVLMVNGGERTFFLFRLSWLGEMSDTATIDTFHKPAMMHQTVWDSEYLPDEWRSLGVREGKVDCVLKDIAAIRAAMSQSERPAEKQITVTVEKM